LADGTNYIYTTYPVVTQLGITMYSGTEGLDIEGIYDGLPIDNNTIYWDIDSDGNRVLKAIGSSGGGVADSVAWSNIEGKPSWLLDDKISYSEIEGTPDLSKYALVSQIPSLEGYALSSDLAKYIPISGYTDVLGEKNFVGGLKVNGSPIYYDKDKKYWKLEGDLLVTGGVSMYSSDTSYTPSTIMDGVAVDGTTISKEGGVLKVIGNIGGVTDFWGLENIPSWISVNKPSYTIGSLTNIGSWADSVAPQDRIMYQAANSSQWVAKNLSDLAVGGVTGGYLPLSGGVLTGDVIFVSNSNSGSKNSIFPSHYYHRFWASNDVYVHFYEDSPMAGTLNSVASLRVASTEGLGFKTLKFSGDGTFTWDYNTIWHSGNFTPSNYLPLSGGTISNNVAAQLKILNSNGTDAYIEFGNTAAIYGHVGVLKFSDVGNAASVGYSERIIFPTAGGMYYRTSYNGTNHIIWHSGNDGSGSGLDADLLDGLDAAAFFYDKGASNSFDDKIYNGAYRTSSFNPNNAYGYGLVASFRSMETCAQIYFPDWNGEPQFRMQWNSQTSITSGWTALITSSSIGNYNAGSATRLQAYQHNSGENVLISGSRTDNTFPRYIYDNGWSLCLRWQEGNGVVHNGIIATLNDNVASATKLQTARTIWGQSFDGTGDIGNKSGSDASSIRIVDNRNNGVGGYQAIRFYYNTDNQATIHYFHNNYNGFAWTTKNLNIDADYITLGSWNNPAMIVNRNTGNVGIGGVNPEYKLHVFGDMRSYSLHTDMVSTVQGIAFFGIGSGTYNVGIIRTNSNHGLEIEAAKSTDSNGGTMLPIFFGWRGGNQGMLLSSGGNLLVNGGVTMYSDKRKKTILGNVELSLKDIANAPLVEHYYNSDQNKTTHVGSIAQYWADMNDWFCKLDNEGFYTMEIQNAALASAISVARELVKFESETDKRIRLLEEENKRLKEEVEQLKWNIA
jgi:hypothetical protein